MTEGRLYVPPGSGAAEFGAAIAWLWRLGRPLDGPRPEAVGVGTLDEADELLALAREGRLAGAAVFAPGAGPERDGVPGRELRRGVAGFGRGLRVRGEF